jgi:hypothetical protein
MRQGGVAVRGNQGFPWHYGTGEAAFPVATRFGMVPQYPWSSAQGAWAPFRVIMQGNPYNSPRPRGPIVSGPPLEFPRPASTGHRLTGGVGTDLFDESTWQRPYRFT